MKITVIPEDRDILAAYLPKLKKVAEKCGAETKAVNELKAKAEKLRTEITPLEKSAVDSEAAAAKLATKRAQLDSIESRWREIEAKARQIPAAVAEHDATLSLLREFGRQANRVFMTAFEAYAATGAQGLRSFCQNDQEAKLLSYQLPAVISLGRTYARPFGSMGGGIHEIQLAIAMAEEFLSGTLNWSFDPKIAK